VQDPYAGFRGALMCLEEKGDIAFVKHSTVEENRGDADTNTNAKNIEIILEGTMTCRLHRKSPMEHKKIPRDCTIL
jgi:hypothetical protein